MPLKVVIAVIEHPQKKHNYLIAKRPVGVHQGGLWEFPGGKVEPDELPEQTLVRELQEELAIEITAYNTLFNFAYNYSDKSIQFFVYRVSEYKGQEQGNENQEILWVDRDALAQFDFPAANKKIINKLLSN